MAKEMARKESMGMRNKVVITRPRPGLEETALQVKALGWKPLLAPMQVFAELFAPDTLLPANQDLLRPSSGEMSRMKPNLQMGEPPSQEAFLLKGEGLQALLTGVQVILVTSRQTVRSLHRLWPAAVEKNIPLFAVGEQTAQEALALGFLVVKSAAGTAKDLALLCTALLKTDQGPLFLASGKGEAVDLACNLHKNGFLCIHCPLYESREVENLPEDFFPSFWHGEIAAILFFSGKAAQIFNMFLRKGIEEERKRIPPSWSPDTVGRKKVQGIQTDFSVRGEEEIHQIKAIVMSERIRKIVQQYPWHHITVASPSTAQEMLKALGEHSPLHQN
ncbi:uroporphyrinogen-III synthase [Entomobacter blattae]|uniref:Uroporphyrinogen-III synthase HemD n=1 Tax=Entomobacter blattae TaxID=2762277 RepID=A0A7H1NRV2_9PROT|nr:uroporphyrinogen-III synthase [Entomobacter blattae]QNT78512.1 Uroporphyrinogen-III synthase HemD [Entomobacter blattae]